MRKKVVAGNWKMNKTPTETITFFKGKLNGGKTFLDLIKDASCDIILCVPFVDIATAQWLTQASNVKIGAQNMHFEEHGAFTGEISYKMLSEMRVEYVIIGHSERRAYFGETDETVNRKVKTALANGIKPIVCVGESLEQREKGETKELITSQIQKAFEGVSAEQMKEVIIAYEPIWAIGTGKTASSHDANEVCQWIRKELHKIYGSVANEMIIQYGGSVKSSNAKELFEMSDIDGGLVGGASLDPEEFAKIITSCE